MEAKDDAVQKHNFAHEDEKLREKETDVSEEAHG